MSITHLSFQECPRPLFQTVSHCVALGLPGIHRDPPAYAFQMLRLQAYHTKPFRSPFGVTGIGDKYLFMPIQYPKQN